jgi:hypothetical protein
MRDAFIEVVMEGQQMSNTILLVAACDFGVHELSLTLQGLGCQAYF